MLNTKKNYLLAAIIFIAAEIILGVLVQCYSGLAYSILTLVSVSIALIFVAFCLEKKRLNILMVITFVFTVLADLFLCGIVENENAKLIAMIFFNFVQIGYFIRIFLLHSNKKQKIVHLTVRLVIILIAVLATILVLRENTNALAIVSLIYYANLIVNIVFSFTQTKISWFLPIGLVLFILCDTFIGLEVMQELFLTVEEGSFIYKLTHTGFNFAWLFYVPSQTLLALSVKEVFLLKKTV